MSRGQTYVYSPLNWYTRGHCNRTDKQAITSVLHSHSHYALRITFRRSRKYFFVSDFLHLIYYYKSAINCTQCTYIIYEYSDMITNEKKKLDRKHSFGAETKTMSCTFSRYSTAWRVKKKSWNKYYYCVSRGDPRLANCSKALSKFINIITFI